MSPVTDGPVPPPAPMPTGPCVPLKQLWSLLPEPNRRQAIQCLGQMIRRQLPRSRPGQEVAHDRH
jgi:hypothetical protein